MFRLDANEEYSAEPLGTDLGLEILPGDSIEVSVDLTNVDAEADTGRILISSNDPDEALVQVPLFSEMKGEPVLESCVMETDAINQQCVTDPEVIDFGQLDVNETPQQSVSVFNVGSGNSPLVIDDILELQDTGAALTVIAHGISPFIVNATRVDCGSC